MSVKVVPSKQLTFSQSTDSINGRILGGKGSYLSWNRGNRISLTVVSEGPIYNYSPLNQAMVCHRIDDKPLLEPMLVEI